MEISSSRIRYLRYLIGFRHRRTTKKPYLSAGHKFERYEWCLAHENCSFNFHLFGDESTSKTLEIPFYHVRFPSSNPRAIGSTTNTKMKVNCFSTISRRGCCGILVII